MFVYRLLQDICQTLVPPIFIYLLLGTLQTLHLLSNLLFLSSSFLTKTTEHPGLEHRNLPLRPTFASVFWQVGHFSAFLLAFLFIISISFTIQTNLEAIPQGLNRLVTSLLKIARAPASPSRPCAFSIISNAFSYPRTSHAQM